MRKLNRTFAAIALIFTISTATFAGDGIIYGGFTGPQPTPTPAASQTSMTTDPATQPAVQITGSTQAASIDPLTEAALAVLQTVLALF